MTTIGNLTTGKPAVDPAKPSHVAGVRQGNKPIGLLRSLLRRPKTERDSRSTGINPHARHPIDERMPLLTPA